MTMPRERTSYHYETTEDGYCHHSSKQTAIRHALQAGALHVRTGNNRIVWTNPRGGEERGEIRDLLGQPLRPQPPA